jgi:DNA gyrase subunit A
MASKENIIDVEISDIMRKRYLDYSMSVIQGRSLPDVRDGLKPIHRRILISMKDLHLSSSAKRKKCARTVGDTLGRFHPHGDTSVYEALVRLGQDFIHKVPLIDGQGNFGDRDNFKSFSAMRYTEARLGKIVDYMVGDLQYDTVKYIPNFDDSEIEPEVLPAAFPYFLVGGNEGIAVGYTTSCLPYNLSEVCDAVIKVIDDPDVTLRELQKVVKGPDFPTGGLIIERKGINESMENGQSVIKVASKYEIKDQEIIVTEIPYLVNKSSLIESIASVITDKIEKSGKTQKVTKAKVPEVATIRDLSAKNKIDIRIKCKKGTNPEVVINKLFKHTRLQETLKSSYTAIVNSRPEVVPFKRAIELWLDFRVDCLFNKNTFLFNKFNNRKHLLEGFISVVKSDPEKAISIIRKSDNIDSAKVKLEKTFKLSKEQSDYVVKLTIGRFAKSEVVKSENEIKELKSKIAFHKKRIDDTGYIYSDISEEILEIKSKFGKERTTEIANVESAGGFDELDLVDEEDTVVFLSELGYIKRCNKEEYIRTQNRGGKGRKIGIKKNDWAKAIISCNTHDDLVFITNLGIAYKTKVYAIQETTVDKIGQHITSLISLKDNEVVSSVSAISDYSDEFSLLIATADRKIKRTNLSKFSKIPSSGLIACKLKEDDEVISSKIIENKNEENLACFIGFNDGKIACFPISEVPIVERTTFGVNSTNRKDCFAVDVSIIEIDKDTPLAIMASNGLGKVTQSSEFYVKHRGNFGSIGIKLQDDARLVGIKAVENEDTDVVVVSEQGKIVKVRFEDLPKSKRPTTGYRVIRLEKENDSIVTFAIES